MDKTIAGLLGAVGALALVTPGQSAPLQPSTDAVLHARTYAELLRPIPNALAALRAMDQAIPEPQVQQVQLGPAVRDLLQGRDHHHHNRYERPRYDHHHHHNRPEYGRQDDRRQYDRQQNEREGGNGRQEYDRRGSVFR